MIILRNIIGLIIIGVAIAALSYQSVFLVDGNSSIFSFYLFSFCLTVFAYNYNKTEKYLFIFSYFCLGLALSIFYLSDFYMDVNILLLVLLTSFYFLLPPKYSIRNLTYIKPAFMAIIWTLMTVKLPIEISQAQFIITEQSEIVLMSIERFFFIYALAIACDIIDLKNDVRSGLETIPNKHGIGFSLILLIASMGIAATASILSYTFTYYSQQSLLGLLISFIASTLILAKIIARRDNQYQKILVDSLMIFQFVAVFTLNSISL